ncbi:hypothetical protein Q9L42_001925 [Methylomarinum sp. Ch1-1]|uniref:Uncharacterized protein n=1 Tax=Methylomarinum roseum TaxID=3067653 RepID=A0AAU7NVC0_9GAMM|nr:hypothetical protein [Methylomarinum sp. Ch1-1]MDP4523062.1 hypothetical protein [Methylomarinum sp. Ch1-1]
MKITKSLQTIIVLGMALLAGNVFAYSSESEDKKCKKPRFRTFEPAHLSEVEPETKISFHVSNWADPATIKAEARKVPMEVDVVDKMNFFVVTAKLPSSVSGKYARIHIEAKAKDGGCRGQDGWLLKVKKATATSEPSAAEAAAETAEK